MGQVLGNDSRPLYCATALRSAITSFRLPLVAGVHLDQPAFGIDDRRPQVVRDVDGIGERPADRDAEPGRELIDVVAIAGQEGPPRRDRPSAAPHVS